LALLLALLGFGRIYYLAVFLPFFLLACLLVAWGLYLKDDGFIRSAPRADAAAAESPGQSAYNPDGAEDRAAAKATGLDLSLYAPRGGGLVPRRDDTGQLEAPGEPRGRSAGPGQGGPGGQGGKRPGGAKRALLWAAIFLGLLASALYSWGGVGAGYFLPVAR
jgi:hypothetical protein